MTSGWELPSEVLDWIFTNIEEGSTVLEFGSGETSKRLSDTFCLISIEHDASWIGRFHENYIHAEIVSNPQSHHAGEKGWYDQDKLQSLPSKVDLIILDGPPGEVGRTGIVEFLPSLPKAKFFIVDDTDRDQEMKLLNDLIKVLKPMDQIEIISDSRRSNGLPRKATILKLR
jgi:hypothetical protein